MDIKKYSEIQINSDFVREIIESFDESEDAKDFVKTFLAAGYQFSIEDIIHIISHCDIRFMNRSLNDAVIGPIIGGNFSEYEMSLFAAADKLDQYKKKEVLDFLRSCQNDSQDDNLFQF